MDTDPHGQCWSGRECTGVCAHVRACTVWGRAGRVLQKARAVVRGTEAGEETRKSTRNVEKRDTVYMSPERRAPNSESLAEACRDERGMYGTTRTRAQHQADEQIKILSAPSFGRVSHHTLQS
eukprot:jgi/Antlo1/1251/2422